jgi:hypothetical protein
LDTIIVGIVIVGEIIVLLVGIREGILFKIHPDSFQEAKV